jgi:hypothetical protein
MDRAGSRIALVSAVLACACACGTGDVLPDAGDSDGDGGASIDASGDGGGDLSALEIEFRTDPEIPGAAGGPLEPTFDHAVFQLANVRAVGDVAALMRDEFNLEFEDRDRPKLLYASAPPGVYSTLIGRVVSFDIDGTVRVGGETEEFEIKEAPTGQHNFVIMLEGATVEAGMTTRVEVRIHLRDIVESIDWTMVESEDGKLEVDDDYPDFDAVLDQILASFELKD